MKASRFTWPFVLVLSLLASCTRLPNVSPFVEATAQMRSAVQKGSGEVEKFASSYGKEALSASDSLSFRQVWMPTMQTLTSLVAYADALNTLAESGQKAEQNFQSVLAPIKSIAKVFTPTALPSVPIEYITKFFGVLAKLEASHALKEKLNQTDSLMSVTADILKANLKSLKALNQNVRRRKRADLEKLSVNERNYYRFLAKLKDPLTEELSLLAQYRASPEAAQNDILTILKQKDNKIRSGDDVENRQMELINQALPFENEMKRFVPFVQTYDDRKTQIEQQAQQIDRLVGQSISAIGVWADTHHAMVEGMNAKRKIGFRELLEVVGDLEQIYQEFQKIKP